LEPVFAKARNQELPLELLLEVLEDIASESSGSSPTPPWTDAALDDGPVCTTDGAADTKREGTSECKGLSSPVVGELNVSAVPLLTLEAVIIGCAMISPGLPV